jgi:hypothetical protein
MPRTREREVGRLDGEGDVYYERKVLGHYRYSLTVYQRETEVVTAKGSEWLRGPRDTRGQVVMLPKGPDLSGDNYWLHLQDGRWWNFLATRGDPIKGAYDCVTRWGDIQADRPSDIPTS